VALRASTIAGLIAALACAMSLSATASASSVTTPTTTTPTPTTPTPTTPGAPAPPASPAASLYLHGEFIVANRPVTVPARAVDVVGVVRPYVPGQWVVLREFLDGRQFRSVRLRLKPSRRMVYGGFMWPVRSPSAGSVTVKVDHRATSRLLAFKVHTQFSALNTDVAPGSTGRFVQLVQRRLAALQFYAPQTGVYDLGTGLAIDAYHRLLRRGTSQLLDRPTIDDLLDGVGAFRIHFPGQGTHAEADLSDQLLALADGSTIHWILPISSGKPSTPTILGSFQIYSRVPGYLPDGMYFSDFFVRGYAIHGYDPAPDYPASHGCLRIPIVDAIPVFGWLSFGDWVDTYYA
jgi:hypothetical protein